MAVALNGLMLYHVSVTVMSDGRECERQTLIVPTFPSSLHMHEQPKI